MNKYKEKSNISGRLIHKARMLKNMSYEKLSDQLQLIDIVLYPNDLFLIENSKRILKDFELVAICKVLDINIYDIFKEF